MSLLSPFFYKGFISENFYLEGNIPDKSDLLHVYVKGTVMIGVFTCSIFVGIPSYL